MRVDIVGDIHGQLDALTALGRQLGYAVDGDWSHPEKRLLVFLGDLVDRGSASLEVAELVERLVREGRALCLMGNHEYNLVGNRLGLFEEKHSNAATIEDVKRRFDRSVGAGDRVLQEHRVAPLVSPTGAADVPADVRAVCIDYNGVTNAKAGSCVGAFRWPEREVTWARIEP